MISATSASPVEVPPDALSPDPVTGTLRPAGRAVTAGTRFVYRVLASKFHDETKMGAPDLLYPLVFAFRVSAKDPAIARATAALRSELVAVRVVRIDTEVEDLGELQVIRDVPVVEIYLKHAADPPYAVAIAPPWSATPWELTALMEAAVERGFAAFSEGEAKRRGIAWLDLVRDRKLHGQLMGLAAAFERQAFVPEPLRGLVTVEQARQRWAALRRFARTRGHLLVTNGPYRLDKWSGDTVVLAVFRDFSYPLGVGTYDRYAMPLRAWVARVERRGDRLEIEADVETVTKAERSFTFAREPFRPAPAGERLLVPALSARWVVLGSGDDVAAAGTSTKLEGARLVVDLKGRLKPGAYRVASALAAAVLGAMLEPTLLRPFYKRAEEYQLLVTFGLLMILDDVIRFLWGPYPLTASVLWENMGSLTIGDNPYPTYNLLVIVVGAAAAVFLWAFIYRTKFGVVLRATSQDMRMAAALGVNVNRTYVQAFTIGCFMAGLGGAIIVPSQSAVLGMGVDALVLSFIVVVIGGLGSLEGALVGALIVGVVREMGITFFPEIELAVLYLMAALVLLVRPAGLFGRA